MKTSHSNNWCVLATLAAGVAVSLSGCGTSKSTGAVRTKSEPLPVVVKSGEQPAKVSLRHPVPSGVLGNEQFFEPFTIDSLAAAERPATPDAGANGTQAAVFASQTSRVEGRRQVNAAVALYGETPTTGLATGSPSEGMVIDGMESLTQVTYASEGASFDPCVSRDGKFIVFASTQHRPTADIYIKPINGRAVTQLTADPAHDVMPAISPDGKRVAFASNRAGSWDVYVMSVSGGQAVQITSDRSHELHPSWSPDGQRLVFCRLGEVSGRWEMWVTNVNAPSAAEFIGYGLFPQWCPVAGTGENGRDKILFQRSRERGDRAFSVWTIDYRPGDASSPTEIASSQIAAVINPTWSPDGHRIVFATVPHPGTTGAVASGVARPAAADLWMTDVNGAGRVNLTAGQFVNLTPTWGPDGRIYFVSDRGGVDNIWSIGTEKAIAAATGRALPGTNRGIANVPESHSGQTGGN